MGGIGAGKSYVGNRVAELGPGTVVNADVIAHEGLRQFAADGRLAAALGDEFVRDGQPDVKVLGARAFEEPALLRQLERLVHPYVHSAIKLAIEAFRSGEGPPLLVLDVPLLIEVGLDRQCDTLWYVDTPDALRAGRAAQRGLTLEQIHLREAFQSPRERKRARADVVIRNDVDAAGLDQQILDALIALGVRSADADPAVGGPTPDEGGGDERTGTPASQEHAS